MPVTVTMKLYKFAELSPKAKEKARDWWRECENECFDGEDFRDRILMEAAHYFHGLAEDMTCYWSLNCCQGDGVAFYDKIDLDGVIKLPHYRYKGGKKSDFPTYDLRKAIRATVQELRGMGFTIYANSEGKHGNCHHWNSMNVRVELQDGPSCYSPWSDASSTIGKLLEDAEQENERTGTTPDGFAGMVAGVREAIDANDRNRVGVFCDWYQEAYPALDQKQQAEDTWRNAVFLRNSMIDPAKIDELEGTLGKQLDEFLTAVSRHVEKIGYEELDSRNENEYIDENIEANDYTFTENGKRRDADDDGGEIEDEEEDE